MIDIEECTPVERTEHYWVKRDDKFKVFNVSGGKARAAHQIIMQGVERGYKEFCTAGSRSSPQCEIVSDICENLGYKCHVFMPGGPDTSVLEHIKENHNTEVIRTKVGYNTVIVASSRKYCEEHPDVYYIPFGMEMPENVEITKHQVKNIPSEVKHIVIPVGSGMNFCAVLNGLEHYGRTDIKVTGVRVGADPKKVIDRYNMSFMVDWEIVKSSQDYSEPAKCTSCDGIELDPIYEGKCMEFLKPDDLLWIVGKRI